MITVQAEILFRVEREADAHRILLAVADLVMPEQDGSVAATVRPAAGSFTSGTPGVTIWEHPHMEGR